ncbi:UNVERIFIED_CONTAM: Ribulose bisphosphate carboxylase small chain, chloroplastic [Sesamum calycinum]|uniref:Ribulose bisphosphate carboxylase small subunit, chloroplastic n=1 Tax=Sesamum calycinum TaxID=2727403 RepID=A0AAW2MNB3_9LAMI
MASSVISSTAAVASRASPAQASMVAPFTGLKSASAFPGAKKSNDVTSLQRRKSAMHPGERLYLNFGVWPTQNKKKFETLSYLPDLTTEQLAKEIDYLIRSNWIPCIEFELEHGFVYREHHRSPGYYDGRYWTMWKLPMYGCTDSSQVLVELNEAIKAHPDGFIRIIGFDNVRQVQCISFIAYKPPGY